MKKFLFMLMIVTALGLVITSCGDDKDDPTRTSTPEISFIVDESFVTVTATGDGEVTLYANGTPVINPYIVERKADAVTIHFTATAQATGMAISETASLDVEIPSLSTFQFESEHGATYDTHLIYDIDLDNDSSSIYIYNAVFTIGEATSPVMNIRIDAPCTFDATSQVFTFEGTDITPYMQRGNTWVPMPSIPVTDLKSTVNYGSRTYDISFYCHGGYFESEGGLL